MERFGLEDDMPIEAGVVSKSIETAQSKVEGHNFDIRKHVLEYDDVVNQQREIIYAQRRRILTSPSLKENILTMVHDELANLVQQHTAAEYAEDWDVVGLYNAIRSIISLPATITAESWRLKDPQELIEEFQRLAAEQYKEKEDRIGADLLRLIERHEMLAAVDRLWVRHLTALDALRTGIGLRAYGQQDPLVAYKREALDMYEMLVEEIQKTIVSRIYHLDILQEPRQAPRNLQARHASMMSQTAASAGGQEAEARAPVRAIKRPGRNDPCWCGSGKKYKQCHMRSDNMGQNGPPVQAGAPTQAGASTQVGAPTQDGASAQASNGAGQQGSKKGKRRRAKQR
jgi:preprotein translocase subunit SecA